MIYKYSDYTFDDLICECEALGPQNTDYDSPDLFATRTYRYLNAKVAGTPINTVIVIYPDSLESSVCEALLKYPHIRNYK
jgi:hypothetical protein